MVRGKVPSIFELNSMEETGIFNWPKNRFENSVVGAVSSPESDSLETLLLLLVASEEKLFDRTDLVTSKRFSVRY